MGLTVSSVRGSRILNVSMPDAFFVEGSNVITAPSRTHGPDVTSNLAGMPVVDF